MPTRFENSPLDPTLGVSDIAGLSGDRLLVLERGYEPTTGNTIRLSIVSTRSPDVSGMASLTTAPAWVFDHRSLLADLVHCPTAGARHPGIQVNPLRDNIQGLYVGGPAGPGRHRSARSTTPSSSLTPPRRPRAGA